MIPPTHGKEERFIRRLRRLRRLERAFPDLRGKVDIHVHPTFLALNLRNLRNLRI